jgi:hypothetical protein
LVNPDFFCNRLAPRGTHLASNGGQQLPDGEPRRVTDEEIAMVRMIMTAGLMMALAVASTAQACDVCAALFKERLRHEGKLIKQVITLEAPPVHGKDILPIPQVRVVWKLKTADRTYTLELGSRTLTRLAAALEGHDVVVTGALKGDEIDVRDIDARPAEYVGRLERWERKDRPAGWKLVTDKGTYYLTLTEAAGKKAETWAGQIVRVKGRMTISGIVVASVEEVRFLPLCPAKGN